MSRFFGLIGTSSKLLLVEVVLVLVSLVVVVVVVLLVSQGVHPSVVEVSWWTSELLLSKEDVSKGSLSHWLSAAKQPTRLSSGPPAGGQNPTRGLSGLPPVELVDAVVGTVEPQLS